MARTARTTRATGATGNDGPGTPEAAGTPDATGAGPGEQVPAGTEAVEATSPDAGASGAPSGAPRGAATDGVTGDDEVPDAGTTSPPTAAAPSGPAPLSGLPALRRLLRPRATRSQVVVAVLCALLGFAVVVQVSQTQEDQLSSLRQSDLVRLLDEVTQRSGELEDQVSALEATRDELQSGSGRQRAALELAEQRAQTQGILSGRLPATGPGIEVEIVEGDKPLRAQALFNVLEELRNAGAEAMEVNGVRLVASSYFVDEDGGIVVDGQPLTSPYRWTAIGDPSTMETALEIPGGAMASVRSDGARTTIVQSQSVEVSATHEPQEPRFATPVPADESD